MEFIQLEADEDSQYQPISNEVDDDYEELTNNEMEDFIDNSQGPEEDLSFYQNLNNQDQYYNFPNQTQNLRNAISEDCEIILVMVKTLNQNFMLRRIEILLNLIIFLDLRNLSRNSKILLK